MQTPTLSRQVPVYLGISGLAATTTTLLLLTMYGLIATNSPELLESEPFRFSVVQEPRIKPELKMDPPPERIPDPEEMPRIEQLNADLRPAEGALLSMYFDNPVIKITGVDNSMGTSSIVPIFRVQPDYPMRAITRGIEGYVDLVFDVTATGKTENIRIIDAQPKGMFERAATRALKKWKYKPPMDEGVPYRQPNMTTRIRFRLEA